jgi:hypothetical protein
MQKSLALKTKGLCYRHVGSRKMDKVQLRTYLKRGEEINRKGRKGEKRQGRQERTPLRPLRSHFAPFAVNRIFRDMLSDLKF